MHSAEHRAKNTLLLLLTAIIWGLAFVAQRTGMSYIGPFTFNGIRFFLGATALLPLLLIRPNSFKNPVKSQPVTRKLILGIVLTGIVLFLASSFQQIGIVYTTAGKAGFITGLYIVIVPFIGLFLNHNIKWNNWFGAIFAVIGLYFLTVNGSWKLFNNYSFGDLLVFISAFLWAVHIMLIAWLAPKINPILISCFQFYICSILSLLTAFSIEHVSFYHISLAAIPILYGGLFSIGIAYTLQVIAQKNYPPAEASLILSLESLFAAIFGWLILNETLSGIAIVGCILILSGIIISQLSFRK